MLEREQEPLGGVRAEEGACLCRRKKVADEGTLREQKEGGPLAFGRLYWKSQPLTLHFLLHTSQEPCSVSFLQSTH